MRNRYRGGDQPQQIDISPLIDMVFILLIFFMVSSTFVKDMDIDIQRPSAASAEPSTTKAVRVYVDARGEAFLDGQPVRTWMIQSRLRDRLAALSDKTVLVVADAKVPAGKLVEVVDQCRLAGADEVAVATDKEVGA